MKLLPEIITVKFNAGLFSWCDRATWEYGENVGKYFDVDFDYGKDYLYVRVVGLEFTYMK